MTNNNTQYSTTLSSYNEQKALQQLLKATDDALTALNAALDANSDDIDREFTITINGIQTAFILGGPQTEALFAFIKHIAAENFYTVDLNKCTVTSSTSRDEYLRQLEELASDDSIDDDALDAMYLAAPNK